MAVKKKGAETLSRNLDGRNNRREFHDRLIFKSQCRQINIFLGGKDGKKSLIQHRIYKTTHFVLKQLRNNLFVIRCGNSQHFAFTADYQYIGSENFPHNLAYIIKSHLTGIVVVKQLSYFPCSVQ